MTSYKRFKCFKTRGDRGAGRVVCGRAPIATVMVLGWIGFATATQGAPVASVPIGGGYLDVEYFAGGGTNTAYFIVDFSGNGGETYAFGYRFDEQQTADIAMFAIDAAGGLLMEGIEEDPHFFIGRFAYLSEDDAPNYGDDTRYWNYWLGEYDGTSVAWESSLLGISGRDWVPPYDVIQPLVDGGFYGFSAWPDPWPSDFPLEAHPRIPVAGIPEPTSIVLAAIAFSVLIAARRRTGTSKTHTDSI